MTQQNINKREALYAGAGAGITVAAIFAAKGIKSLFGKIRAKKAEKAAAPEKK